MRLMEVMNKLWEKRAVGGPTDIRAGGPHGLCEMSGLCPGPTHVHTCIHIKI